MPRHRVINSRNVSPLKKFSVTATDDGFAAISEVARHLGVSQGSVVDVAFRYLATLEPAQVVELLAAAGHLTPDEHTVVVDALKGPERKP